MIITLGWYHTWLTPVRRLYLGARCVCTKLPSCSEQEFCPALVHNHVSANKQTSASKVLEEIHSTFSTTVLHLSSVRPVDGELFQKAKNGRGFWRAVDNAFRGRGEHHSFTSISQYPWLTHEISFTVILETIHKTSGEMLWIKMLWPTCLPLNLVQVDHITHYTLFRWTTSQAELERRPGTIHCCTRLSTSSSQRWHSQLSLQNL